MTHLLPCVLFFVFAALAANAQSGSHPYKVYFYDTEFSNTAVTCHMWARDEATGADSPRPGFTWETRPCLEFTGKKVVLNGNEYPVYIYEYDDYPPTHLLFRREANGSRPAANTPDLEYKDGALYNIDGLVSENFDASTLIEIADGEHGLNSYTVYFKASAYMNYNWNNVTDYNTNQMGNVYVHVWGPSGDLLPWNYNGHPVKSKYLSEQGYYDDRFAWINGPDYEDVYEYTFRYFGETPTGILFRCLYSDWVYEEVNGSYQYVKKDLSEQTPDLAFSDGALYYAERFWRVSRIDEPKIYDGRPYASGTVYLIDTDKAVNTSSMYAPSSFFINGAEDYSAYVFADTSFGEKYVRLNGHWYPVYRYNFDNSNTALPQEFRVGNISDPRHRLSAPLEFRDGGVYWFGGKDVATPVYDIGDLELVDAADLPAEDPGEITVYAHLGANQLMEKELWEVPYCMPYLRQAGKSPYANLYEAYEFRNGTSIFPRETDLEADGITPKLDKYRMTEVAPGLYSYTFTPDGDFDDLVFFYYFDEVVSQYVRDDQGNYVVDPETGYYLEEWGKTGQRAVADLTASRSLFFNPTQLTEYVYDIGVDCFHQSYLTVEDYKRLCAERASDGVKSIYLTGNEAVTGHGEDDPLYSTEVKDDHGCFFVDFEVSEAQPASFKASTVDVPSLAASLPEGMYSFQRGWASFNLGLIGCDFPAKKEGETEEEYEARYDEWYAAHVVKPGGVGSNREIRVQLNEAYSYNDYCQYPWRVEVGDDHGMKAGRYWMVIDLLPEDQSVALLDFDPHPHCNATDITVRQETVTNEMAQAIHDRDGVGLEGVKYVGLSALRQVNVASGSIRIGDTENSLIGDEGFDNTYTIYLDDQPAYRCTGRPDRLEVDQLDVSDNASIAIRGRFHDKKTDRYFATRYSHGSIDFNVGRLPGPGVEHGANQVGRYGGGTVSAVDDMTVTLSESRYTAYPDFRIVSLRIDGDLTDEYTASIAHADHPMQQSDASAWACYLGWTMGEGNHWVPFDGQGQITDANNWAEYIKAEKHLPLSIDIDDFDSKKSANSSRQNDIVAYAEVLASYPFLVYHPEKVLDIQGAYDTPATTASLKAENVPARELKAETSKYVVLSVPLGMSLDFGSGVMTGVDAVETSPDTGADSTPEYFNLQGIRVSASSLSPGIYIERRGDRSRKIYVE